jgi:hypothetical protein
MTPCVLGRGAGWIGSGKEIKSIDTFPDALDKVSVRNRL